MVSIFIIIYISRISMYLTLLTLTDPVKEVIKYLQVAEIQRDEIPIP